MSSKFEPIRLLVVELDFDEPIRVGRLAYVGRKIVFEFDPDFPTDTLNISPFLLQPTPG